MSSSQPQRLTMRQADAQDRRHRMTQQRQELTHRIRKQKKSEYLARKRQYAATTSSSSTTTTTATATSTLSAIDCIRPLILDFCSIPTLDKLRALHDALQATPLDATEENWLVVLPADDLATASSLIGHLQGPAASSPMTTTSPSEGLTLVLNILVRLTAISYTPPTSSGGSISSSSIGFSYYYGNPPVSWSSLVSHNRAWLSLLVQLAPQSETACVVLGNLVGEANSQSFVQMRQAGLIPALLSAVHQPAAAWALTNAIRHDTAEYAMVYCNDQALSAALLEQLLKEEPVATQAAWMLATLTNREEKVVQYLMSHPTFPTTLTACMKRPTCKDQLAPLVQALGNIATTSVMDGGPAFAGALLTSLPTLTPMLGQLLQIPTNREVVNQAAWLAGCLLQDARIPNHPASTIAAPHLVPLLFQELRENTPHSLDNQRELTQALWSAMMKPPQVMASSGNTSTTTTSSVPVPLPSWDLVRSSLFSLVKLAGSRVDMDASIAALSVLELLLQESSSYSAAGHINPRCRTDHELLLDALQENDITSVLEGVCDIPNNDEAAEVAANLLDNYFYKDNDDDDNDIGFMDAHNNNKNNNNFSMEHTATFLDGPFVAFGLPPAAAATDTAAPALGSNDAGMGRGMGRGRGAPMVPAWMSAGQGGSS